MISKSNENILRHKVRGKLSAHWPSVPREVIEEMVEKAILDVRENDDWLFDMLVDVATASAKEHLHAAVFNGTV